MVKIGFTAKDINDRILNELEAKQTKFRQYTEELEAKMMKGAVTKGDISDYAEYITNYSESFDIIRKWQNKGCDKDYELFCEMANTLNSEFDAVVENDTIRFKWYGHSINFAVKMLAAMFNLHCGMFTFNSSFTTHEAYTENEHRIHIGIDNADKDTVLIEFHLLDMHVNIY